MRKTVMSEVPASGNTLQFFSAYPEHQDSSLRSSQPFSCLRMLLLCCASQEQLSVPGTGAGSVGAGTGAVR